MTFRERRDRVAEVKGAIQSARERFAAALHAERYNAAMACQMEIENLQSAARRLEHRNAHELYPTWEEIA